MKTVSSIRPLNIAEGPGVLLGFNPRRLSIVLCNNSDGDLLVAFDDVTTATSYSIIVLAGTDRIINIDRDLKYFGRVSFLWSTSTAPTTGEGTVTEISSMRE